MKAFSLLLGNKKGINQLLLLNCLEQLTSETDSKSVCYCIVKCVN